MINRRIFKYIEFISFTVLLEHLTCTKTRNTGTLRTPRKSGKAEKQKKTGIPNLTVLFCFPITDHVKMNCRCNLFTDPCNTKELKSRRKTRLFEYLSRF